MSEGLTLLLTEKDLTKADAGVLKTLNENDRVMGDDDADNTAQALCDMLPRTIAKKVEEILPPGFAVSELELCLSVEGRIFGSGVAGDVTVRLTPRE